MNEYSLKNGRGGDEGKGKERVCMFMQQSASVPMSLVFGNIIYQ